MLIAVRHAAADDIEWILSQLRELSAFFGSRRPLFGDPEYVRGYMLGLIKDHAVFIAESPKARIGLVAGALVPHPFNPEIKLLGELAWWVSNAYRGTKIGARAGLELIDAFTRWGNERADWITFGLQEHSPVGHRSILKRGFKFRERYFLREVC